jgi:hypothetical protein
VIRSEYCWMCFWMVVVPHKILHHFLIRSPIVSSLTDLILISAYCWKIPSFGDCDPLLIPDSSL